MERQRGVLLAGNGESVYISLGGRAVAERGAGDRPAPPSPQGFVDREEATGIILGSLQHGLTSIEVTGKPGIGKSWLLRHAGAKAQTLFSGGVVRAPAGTFGGADLLQALFEAFYTADERCRPARRELREYFKDTRALMLVDDAALDDTAVEQLQYVAPDCAVLLVTRQPTLQRDNTAPIVLGGLSATDSMALLERVHAGPFTGARFNRALELSQTLRGHPERLARGSLMEAGPPPTLEPGQRAVVDMLAAFHPNAVPVAVLARLSGRRDALDTIEVLIGAGWIYQDDGQVRLLPHAVGALEAPAALLRQRRIDGLVRLAHHATHQPRATALKMVPLPILWFALTAARESHCWLDVLAIVRAWDVPLVLACQWDAAKRMLDWHAEAAWTLGDEHERAWALHQRGTLELAQGYPPLAAQLLRESFALAERVEDHSLAASARYHLGWLTPEAPPEGWASTSGPAPLSKEGPFTRPAGMSSPAPFRWPVTPHTPVRSLGAQLVMAAAIALAGILAVAAVLRMSDAPAADVRASVSAGNEEAVTGLTRPIADPSPERR